MTELNWKSRPLPGNCWLPKFNFGLRLSFSSTSGWYIVLRVREMASAVVDVHVGLRNPLAEDDVAIASVNKAFQNAPKCTIFKTKVQKFSGEGGKGDTHCKHPHPCGLRQLALDPPSFKNLAPPLVSSTHCRLTPPFQRILTNISHEPYTASN